MPWLTILPVGTLDRFWPSNITAPERGRRRPAMVFSVVDLPAPLAPIRVTISS